MIFFIFYVPHIFIHIFLYPFIELFVIQNLCILLIYYNLHFSLIFKKIFYKILFKNIYKLKTNSLLPVRKYKLVLASFLRRPWHLSVRPFSRACRRAIA